MSRQRRIRLTITTLAGALALVAVALLLAGCGGSATTGTPPEATSPPKVGNVPNVVAAIPAGPARTQSEPTASRTSSRSRPTHRATRSIAILAATPPPVHAPKIQRARITPSDEPHGTAPSFNPCGLVTVNEAQAIVGGPIVGRLLAPLGPTCVYKLGGAKREITMAVELLSFSQVTHEMKTRAAVTVGQREGYCGRLGTDMLFVPLGHGQLLNVTAPCAIAPRFASLAVSRLTG